jgi:predicted TIM-barrel fold metal-dependent hydrolase/ADP-ribose pyrophosphatase YjhB (NUDIX family)
MDPIKHSVAVAVRGPEAGTFLLVRRPDDPADPLAGVWGLPAVTLAPGEGELDGVIRAGRDKLGVQLTPTRRIGTTTGTQNGVALRLTEYEAMLIHGTPVVPQGDSSVTQYTACRYTAEPAELAEAASRGSLCAQLFLADRASAGEALAAEAARATEFRERIGVAALIDSHVHFMPERLLAAVWAYFDAAGPLIGRSWPIAYRQSEDDRVAMLRALGVRAFTAMLYPHKPGMARSLNDWAAGFAARVPECLHTATFFAEPSAEPDVRRAIEQGARVFKCHLQVGGFDPNDPVLDAAWGLLAEAGIPAVTHCGSGPVPGRYTGPEPIAALLARHPRLRMVIAHLGMPEYAQFLDLAEQYPGVLLDTTLAFTPFLTGFSDDYQFPAAGLPRLAALGDRVLLGTDFPNIPHSYADALESLERAGLGPAWLRAVCHDNAARVFGI